VPDGPESTNFVACPAGDAFLSLCPMADGPENVADAPAQASDPAAFWRALVVAAVALVALDWLLGSLLWLPFYGGLLGFFIEGLIAGGIAFRFARPARPASRKRLWSGIAILVVVSMAAILFFEYWHFCGRVGRPPHFPRSRNHAQARADDDAGRRSALDRVGDEAIAEFRAYLSRDYPPGGPLGYARWATSNGFVELSVRDESQKIEAMHRGWVWPVRTAIGAVLLAFGLSLAFDALKSPEPVCNVLLPGEEYEEIDD